MPLLRFDVIEGRDDAALKKLLDTAHYAMVKAFDVPVTEPLSDRSPASAS